MSGSLYVVGTPIGNLNDLTERAVATIREADLILCEDTRRTRKLLTHLGLSKPLLRCDEAALDRATPQVMQDLRLGSNIVFVSDAGTPSVSDPGARLVQRVTDSGYRVVPIPGVSAVTALLSVAGFPVVPFQFLGFLSKKRGARHRTFSEALDREEAFLFFETPPRILRTLAELCALAPTRGMALGRELTKMHEEVLRGTTQEIFERLKTTRPRGEFTVAVSGKAPSTKSQ